MSEFRQMFNSEEPAARQRLRSLASPPGARAAPTVQGPAQRAVAASIDRGGALIPRPPAVPSPGAAPPVQSRGGVPIEVARRGHRELQQKMAAASAGLQDVVTPAPAPQTPVVDRSPRLVSGKQGPEIATQRALRVATGDGGGLFASTPSLQEQIAAIESLPDQDLRRGGEGFEPVRNLFRGLAAGGHGLGESTGTILRYLGGEANIDAVANLGENVEDFFRPRMRKYIERASRTYMADQNIIENPELMLDPDFLTFSIGQIIPSLLASITPAGLARAGVKRLATGQLARSQGARLGTRAGHADKLTEKLATLKVGNRTLIMTPTVSAKMVRIGKAANAVGLAAGGISGGALEGSATYRETFDTLIEQGVPEDVARETAENAFLMMTAGSGVLNSVGLKGLMKLFDKQVSGIKARALVGLQEAVTEYLEGPLEAGIQLGQETITPEQAMQKIKDEANVLPAAFLTAFLLPGAGGNFGASNDNIKPTAESAADAIDPPDPGGLPPVDPGAGAAGQAVNVITEEASGQAQAEAEGVDETTQQEADEQETTTVTGEKKAAPAPAPAPEPDPSPAAEPADDEVVSGDDLVTEPEFGPEDDGDVEPEPTPEQLAFDERDEEPTADDILNARANLATDEDGEFEISKQTVKQLKVLAEELGVKTTGKKSDLVTRITDASTDLVAGRDTQESTNAKAIRDSEDQVQKRRSVTEGVSGEGGTDLQQQAGRAVGSEEADRAGAEPRPAEGRAKKQRKPSAKKPAKTTAKKTESVAAVTVPKLTTEQQSEIKKLLPDEDFQVVGDKNSKEAIFAAKEGRKVIFDVLSGDESVGKFDTFEEAFAEHSKRVEPAPLKDTKLDPTPSDELPAANEKVKAALAKVGSKDLTDEVNFLVDTQLEGEESVTADLYVALQDAEQNAEANEDKKLLRAARLANIELGVYSPVTEEELSRIQVSSGKKFDFQLDGIKYRFNKHLLDPAPSDELPAPTGKPVRKFTGISSQIRELTTGSEPVAELFTSDPDGLANLANTLNRNSVTERSANAARDQIYRATQDSLADAPDVITVFRGGDVTSDIVPVTTNKAVAERFAKKAGVEVQEFQVKKTDILASMEAVNGKLGFNESELLVSQNKLSGKTLASDELLRDDNVIDLQARKAEARQQKDRILNEIRNRVTNDLLDAETKAKMKNIDPESVHDIGDRFVSEGPAIVAGRPMEGQVRLEIKKYDSVGDDGEVVYLVEQTFPDGSKGQVRLKNKNLVGVQKLGGPKALSAAEDFQAKTPTQRLDAVERGEADELFSDALFSDERISPDEVHFVIDEDKHSLEVGIRDSLDHLVGYIGARKRGGTQLQIVSASIRNMEFRGQGFGKQMIKEIHKAAQKRGMELVSDTVVSGKQLRAYMSLRKEGWRVEFNNEKEVQQAIERVNATEDEDFNVMVGGEPMQPVVVEIKSPAQIEEEAFDESDFQAPLFKDQKLVERAATSSRVSFNAEESAAIEALASAYPDQADRIRARARSDRETHPPSQGWARMTATGVKTNEAGQVTALTYKTVPYTFHQDKQTGRAFTKSKPSKQKRDRTIAALAKKMVQEVRAIEAAAKSGKEWAQKIMLQRTWYTAVTQRLRNEFGGAADLVADLLGATSPQNPVPENFKDTIDAARQLSEGKFDSIMKQYVAHIDKHGTPAGYTGPVVSKINGKNYGINTLKTMQAMSRVWRVVRPGQAPKARNFTGNLIGFSDFATIDVWAARFMQRLRGVKRVPPKAEGPVRGEVAADGVTITGAFGFAQEVFDKAAAELGMTPKDLQAIAWFMEKRLWETSKWTSVEGGSFDEQLDFANFNRVLAGISIQQASQPTMREQNKISARIKKMFQGMKGSISFRQSSTLGLYEGVAERAFDVEATVAPSFEMDLFVEEMAAIGQENNQDDVFISRVIGIDEQNANARPGIEVYFSGVKTLKEAQPILDSLVAQGVDGLTMVVDPRARLSGIDTGQKFIGVRYQFVPEIKARHNANFVADVRKRGIDVILQEETEKLIGIAEKLLALGAADYQLFQYDTLVIGKENYGDYTASARGTNQATGRQWFGGAVDQAIEAAVSRYEQGRARPGVRRGGEQAGGSDTEGALFKDTKEEQAQRSEPRSVRSPVSLARLADTFGQAVSEIYGRFGTFVGRNTQEDVKIYNLDPLVADPQRVLDQAAQHGFLVKFFSFVEDAANGIEFKIPNLKKDGYQNGTVWIYNPRNPEGSFKDEDYTTAWRVTHELGHGITEQLMQEKYGDSKRFGRMGREHIGQRGKPPKQVDVVLEPLTLEQAQRAVEWEEVTFRVQRILLEELGVTISNEQFNQENRINLADAMYRSLTGEFGEPGEAGLLPSDAPLDVKDVLIALEETEALLAQDQVRSATKGIDLNTWQRVSDEQLRAAIKRAKQNGRSTPTEKATASGKSTAGAILTAKDLRPGGETSEVAPAPRTEAAAEGAVEQLGDPHLDEPLFKSDRRVVVFRDPKSRGETPTGVEADRARFHVLDIIQKMFNIVEIRIVQSQSDLPAKFKNRVQGVFFPKANRLYIVADNHSTLAEIERTMLHEVFGHYAMRSLPNFARIQATVQELIDGGKDKTLKRIVKDVRARGTVKDDLFIEEVIAHFSEESSTTTALAKEMLALMKEFIRGMGFNVRVSNTEIMALIRASRRRAEKQSQAAGALGIDKSSNECRNFLKSDNLSNLRKASNDEEIGTALEALAKEFDKPLFSDRAKMGGDLDDRWEEKMNIPRSEMSFTERIKSSLQQFHDLSFDSITQGLIDSGNAIKTNEISVYGELLDASVSPYKSYSTLRNINNVMGAVMKHGIPALQEDTYTLADGTQIRGMNFVAPQDGQGFNSVLDPLQEIPGESQVRNWETYAVALRAKFNIQQDKAAGRTGDRRREKLIDEKLADETIAWAQTQVAPNGKTYAEIYDEVLTRWNKMNQQNIDLAIETGVLNKEEAKIWRDNPYVPFWRELAQLEQTGQVQGAQTRVDVESAGIYRLTGSMDREGNPVKLEGNILESMFLNTAYLLDRSYHNESMRRIAELGMKSGALTKAPKIAKAVLTISKKELIDLLWKTGIINGKTRDDATAEFEKMSKTDKNRWQTFFSRVKPPGPNIVSVMDKGKPQYYYVEDRLFMRSVSGMTGSGLGVWMTAMRTSKKWLTVGVTTDPAFMIANWMRDTITSLIVSNAPLHSLADPIKGLRDAYNESDALLAIAFAGRGGGNFYDTNPDQLRDLIKQLGVPESELAGFMKTVVSPRQLWKWWKRVGSASEFGNRVRVYNALTREFNGRVQTLTAGGMSGRDAFQQAVDEGLSSPAEAAYQAQDMLNFTRSGDWIATQNLIQMIPFLNARIQGLNRLYRGAKDNPVGFTMKAGVLMAASLALAIKNDDDDRYNELAEWDKDTYYHFFIGDQHWRLPKPFESGVLFSTIPERMYRAGAGIDGWDVFGQSVLHGVTETFMFNPIPQLFKPWAEDYVNYSFFTDTPIISMGQENLLPERQYDFRTGEFARWVGQALPDVAPDFLQSPKRLEALIRGYFGALGVYSLSVANVMTDSVLHGPDRAFGEIAAKRLHELPVVSRFKRGDVATSTKYNRILWEMVREADALARTIKKYQEEGEGYKALGIARDEAQVLAARPTVRRIANQVSEINRQLNSVALNRRISPERRRTMQDQLLKRRNALAAQVDPLIEFF
jgi:hypothetical protein